MTMLRPGSISTRDVRTADRQDAKDIVRTTDAQDAREGVEICVAAVEGKVTDI